MGYHGSVENEIGGNSIIKRNYLAYWKEGGNTIAIKGVVLQVIESKLDPWEVLADVA